MKTLTFLNLFSGKLDGQNLPASTWNSMIENIKKGAQINPLCFEPLKVEKLVGGTWTVVSSPSRTVGNTLVYPACETYRISGLHNGRIMFDHDLVESLVDFTKVYLNNCYISTSTEGMCLYSGSGTGNSEKKSEKFTIITLPGTENYMLQLGTTSQGVENIEKKGAIHSDRDLRLTGAGFLYIENAIGHGVRGSELQLKGNGYVFVNTVHDGFHGVLLCDVIHGNYYILNAKDGFGTGVRDTGEETSLRGIARVFGGNIHVLHVTENVFDSKYERCDLYSDDNYYSNTDTIPANLVKMESYISGFHGMNYVVDGPGVSNNNIFNNESTVFTAQCMESAVTSLGGYQLNTVQPGVYVVLNEALAPVIGLADSDGNLVYTILENAAYVVGRVDGTIICPTQSTELYLVGCVIKAPTNGENAGVAIKYTASKKNIQILTIKGSEGSYIFGTILSENNIKITPKKDSVLYIEAPGVGNGEYYDGIAVCGSSIYYCNGGGDIIIHNSKIGSLGTELWIGNDDDASAGKNLTGDLVIENNYMCDLIARTNSTATKKGFINLSTDFEGNAFVGSMKTSQCFTDTTADRELSAKISGYLGGGQLFYLKILGPAKVFNDCIIKCSTLENSFLNKI